MPRKSKGPYLYWVKSRHAWAIRDGRKFIRTGFGESQTGDAEKRLAEYISEKWEPDTSQKRPSDTILSNVIMAYLEQKLPAAKRPNELVSICDRLIGYWGTKRVNEIIGATCREFADQSTTPSVARHDLEMLRASVGHYAKEFGLDYTPKFTLPEKGAPRANWLTRSQAAALLKAAKASKNKHLVRFILIGLYTGTRAGAIFDLQWFPNLEGGYIDLDHEIMYREPPSAKKTKKRKPPIAIPYRLLSHMRRWKKLDTSDGATITHVVNYKGNKVYRIKRSWDTAKKAAGLPEWVIPHSLRHTSVTWAMQSGEVSAIEAEGFFGLTPKVMQEVYLHHHPDHQENIRKVF